jgi:hypothetical protein
MALLPHFNGKNLPWKWNPSQKNQIFSSEMNFQEIEMTI